MDSRTRVRNAIERKPIDRIPRNDSPWIDTIERWKSEGLPGDAELADFFDFDFKLIGVDTSMRYRRELISEDNAYRVIRDRYGYTVRNAVGVSRAFEVLDCVASSRTAAAVHFEWKLATAQEKQNNMNFANLVELCWFSRYARHVLQESQRCSDLSSEQHMQMVS